MTSRKTTDRRTTGIITDPIITSLTTTDHPGAGAADSVGLGVDRRRICRAVALTCLVLELAFLLLDYHVNYGRLTDIGALRRLTNVAREDSLASWFASTQTLLVGLTAWAVWLAVRAAGGSAWRRVGWLLVAVLFTYMAVDDGAQIHERVAAVFDRAPRAADSLTSRFPSYTWQVLFVPVLGSLTGLAGLFLWRELGAWQSTVLLGSALLLFAAAVGLDFLEGLDADHPWNVYSLITARYDVGAFTQARFGQTPYDALQHFSRVLEEFFEMLANTCVWVAILGRAGAGLPDIRLRIGA